MKLSKRIRDFVRASLTSPPRTSGLRKAVSPTRMEAQLEQIRKSLTRAAAREKRLQGDLALAEQEGRERDAIRLSRELASLAQSRDELQAALDLIESHLEMERESRVNAELRPSEEVSLEVERAHTPQTSLADENDETDLTARKERLAAPEERRGSTAAKPH